jgi:chaperonin GroEL
LLRASIDIESKLENTSLTEGEKVGANILLKACKSPFSTIISNAGLNSEVIATNLTDAYSNGYDSRNGVYCDMIQTGIIDPAKVTRSAVENAASVSGLMITTECVLIEEPTFKEEK